MTWLLVAAGGAAGALCRYAIALASGPRTLPAATLGINLAGSFLLGLAMPFVLAGRVSPRVATAVTVGFLGAFTTFSTFAWELFDLGRADRVPVAALYLVASVAGGIALAAMGFRLGATLTR